MKFLVTGCRGFVGGSIGDYAAGEGHEVLGIARSGQPAPGWPGKYVQADVLHADLTEAIRDFAPDVVLHAAGSASVAASLAAPVDDLRASVLTWANVLDSVRRSGLRPVVVFPSSAAVYGNPARLPVAEDMPVAPISPYGFHKTACELLAREYAECYGVRIVVARLFSVFGPRQRRLLVWEIYRQLVEVAPEIWLDGMGDESRDFLSVDDVCTALIGLAKSAGDGGGSYTTVNVAAGVETSVQGLACLMRDLIAPEKEVRCRGVRRTGDPLHWCADVSLLRRLLPGWRASALEAMIADCAASWHRETSREATLMVARQ